MKNTGFKLLIVLAVSVLFLSACSGTRYGGGAQHNRGVNNRHFSGY